MHHSTVSPTSALSKQAICIEYLQSYFPTGRSILPLLTFGPAGFERGSAHHVAAEAALQLQSTAGMGDIMHFPLDAAAHLPPTVLMSSCTDVTVPW